MDSLFRRNGRRGLACPEILCGQFEGYAERIRAARRDLTWAILKARTENTAGPVHSRSADPRDPPAIAFHCLEEASPTQDHDTTALAEAAQRVRAVAEHYRDLFKAEEVPGSPSPRRDGATSQPSSLS